MATVLKPAAQKMKQKAPADTTDTSGSRPSAQIKNRYEGVQKKAVNKKIAGMEREAERLEFEPPSDPRQKKQFEESTARLLKSGTIRKKYQ